MKDISLWSIDQQPDWQPEILLLKSEDEELYRLWAEDTGAKRPARLYLIMPAGYDAEIVLAHYIKYRLGRADNYKVSLRGSETLFFDRWENLVSLINRYDMHSYAVIRETIPQVDIPLLPHLADALNFLDELTESILTPLAESGLYLEGDARDRAKWWHDKPGWLTRVRAYQERLRSHSGAARPLALRVEQLVESLIKVVSRLHQPSIGNVLYHASAYAFALAELRFQQKRLQESCVLAHRAIDLFLQHRGVNEGILAEFPEGLGFVKPDPSRELVTLMNTEHYLVRDAGLAKNPKRLTFLRWLNGLRNSLLYTHGFHGSLETEADDAIKEIADIVRKIGDGGRWRHTVASMLPSPIVESECLFDFEAGISTYLREAQP